jgi:endoglucanase
MKTPFISLISVGVLLAACAPLSLPPGAAPTPAPSALEQAAQLGRGINFGNALEAPREGEWGVTLQESFFDLVKLRGFQTIRLPVRWSAHALPESPYTIDNAIFERVDWAIEQATQRGLNIVVNVHHYEELMREPEAHRERFKALWKQIAERYRAQPNTVLFELLNEPTDQLTVERWNALLAETLAVVRQSNPTRNIVIGGVDWNSVRKLGELELPADDRHIIGTFHYYLPFEFTHQGAEWVNGANAWLGTTWEERPATKSGISNDFARAVRWSEETGRPVWLGEFGAYSKADMVSRSRWTHVVAREAEQHGIGWAYWEFCSGFGVYDAREGTWNEELVTALVPDA